MPRAGASAGPPGTYGTITVRVSKTKVSAYTAFGLALTVVSLLAAVYPSMFESVLPTGGYFMLIGVALFGAGTVRGVMELMSSAPILTVTREGISVDPATMGDYIVPWSQVRAFEVRRTFVQSILYVVLDDAEPLIEHQTASQRLLCRILHPKLRSSGVLVVADGTLSVSVSQILSCIHAEFRDELERYRIRAE